MINLEVERSQYICNSKQLNAKKERNHQRMIPQAMANESEQTLNMSGKT